MNDRAQRDGTSFERAPRRLLMAKPRDDAHGDARSCDCQRACWPALQHVKHDCSAPSREGSAIAYSCIGQTLSEPPLISSHALSLRVG